MIGPTFLILVIAIGALTQSQYIKPKLADDDKVDFVWLSRKKVLVDAWSRMLREVNDKLVSVRDNSSVSYDQVACSLRSLLRKLEAPLECRG